MGVEVIAGLALVAAQIFTGIWGLFQKKRAKTFQEGLEVVSDGLIIITDTIEKNKGVVKSTDVGRAITKNIREYGPKVTVAVDAARSIAKMIEVRAYEENEIRKEIAERAKTVAARKRK